MPHERYVSEEFMDALTEWIFCHWPCALEEKEFIRGIFFLCEEEVRQAVEREREHQFLRVRQPCSQ